MYLVKYSYYYFSPAIAPRCDGVLPNEKHLHLNGITAFTTEETFDVDEARKNCSAAGRSLPLFTDERGATMAKWITGEDLC